MGFVWNVILSFDNEELWEDGKDEPRETCEPLERINAWLPHGRLVSLIGPTYDGDAGNGIDANLYGGGFKHFDIEGFIEVVKAQDWKARAKVQLWVKGAEEGMGTESFTLVKLGGRRAAALKATATRKRRSAGGKATQTKKRTAAARKAVATRKTTHGEHMFYAVSVNRGLVTEKGKGTDKFLNPLIVHGQFQSYAEAEGMYGKKLDSIMGYCGIIEVHESQSHAFSSWVSDVTSRYRAGTLRRNDLTDEIKSVALRFSGPGESV
jgi:hypothetical protein